MTREDDWLWLCSTPGLYRSQMAALLHYFGTVEEIRKAPASEWDFWVRNGLTWVRKLEKRQRENQIEADRECLRRKDLQFICWEDPLFPEALRLVPDYPYGLFYRGKLPQPDKRCIAVIGARACSEYGRRLANQIGRRLAENGAAVVSGLALGIDSAAQMAAVEAGGESYAFLGNGADICYPKERFDLYSYLPQCGALISEYAPSAPPLKTHFPLRNRLISGLADTVIVLEAAEKSGSLITADQALDQGKDVYALPGRSTDRLSYGCNRLIDQGAGIILSVDRLMEDLGLESRDQRKKQKARPSIAMNPEQQKICTLLSDTPVSREWICQQTGLPLQTVTTVLMELYFAGEAAEVGRNLFVRR